MVHGPGGRNASRGTVASASTNCGVRRLHTAWTSSAKKRRCRSNLSDIVAPPSVARGYGSAGDLPHGVDDVARRDAEAVEQFLGLPAARDLTNREDLDCLLYTSDAADDLLCVDLGGRR